MAVFSCKGAFWLWLIGCRNEIKFVVDYIRIGYSRVPSHIRVQYDAYARSPEQMPPTLGVQPAQCLDADKCVEGIFRYEDAFNTGMNSNLDGATRRMSSSRAVVAALASSAVSKDGPTTDTKGIGQGNQV